MSKRIALYRFEDSVSMLKSIFIIHFTFVFFLALAYGTGLPTKENLLRIVVCGISALLYLIPYLVYNWQIQAINIFLVLVLFFILGLELFTLGVPARPIGFNERMSKGFIFDIMISFVPYVYVGIRVLSLIPATQVIWTSFKLNQYDKGNDLTFQD